MGKRIEPWWTFKLQIPVKGSARIYHLKTGPIMWCLSKFGRNPHWHFHRPRWVGTQTFTWMDGDCF